MNNYEKQVDETSVDETGKDKLTVREKYENILYEINILKQKKQTEGIMNQFNNIEKFIFSMSVEEMEFVYDKLMIISQDPISNKNFPSSASPLEPLGVYYLIALKNFDFVHDIDDSMLFYTINSLRCIPFEQYEMVLNVLTNKKLVKILTNENIKYNRWKDTDEIRVILSKLMDKFNNNILSFSAENLDETMDNFIQSTVFPKLKN